MNGLLKQPNNQKKLPRRKYIIAAGVILLFITSALVFSLFQQEVKPDPASEAVIREYAARKHRKDPNDLTDEDFAIIKDFFVGTMGGIDLNQGLVYEDISDIKLLENFTNLQELRLQISFPEENIPGWMKFARKRFKVDFTKRFALDLTPLENLTHLENVTIWGDQIKDLKPLSKLVNLLSLSLSGTLVNGDLKPLKKLPNLENLELYNSEIRDLGPLKELTNLKKLSIDGSKIKDLKSLKNLSNLQNLFIYNTEVSNIEPLKGLKKLEKLYIVDCNNISDEQVEDLQEALPKLEVKREVFSDYIE